jgi:DNA-binding Xre family transcriptional regulator
LNDEELNDRKRDKKTKDKEEEKGIDVTDLAHLKKGKSQNSWSLTGE